MIVTEMNELSNARSKVYIDNEFAFVLYKGELRNYHIKVGEEIAEVDYLHIMEEILPKRAILRCMNLLKSRMYTRKQLVDKLKEGFYPQHIIEIALDYVESYGYVDDSQYTIDFIEYNCNSKSKSRIRNDLLKKGISTEITDAIWEEIIGNDVANLEKEQIINLLKKKNFCHNTASTQEKQKMFAFLYHKGFQIDTIRSILSLDIT